MTAIGNLEGRTAEIWRCVERVNDPELDESVAGLGFVETLTVGHEGQITIELRLPTYWCSPNFVF